MLNMESPMLALLLKHLPEEKQKELWDDNNTDWIFQQKVDGNGQIITFVINQTNNWYKLATLFEIIWW